MNRPVRETYSHMSLYKSEYTGYVLHMPFQRLGYGVDRDDGEDWIISTARLIIDIDYTRFSHPRELSSSTTATRWNGCWSKDTRTQLEKIHIPIGATDSSNIYIYICITPSLSIPSFQTRFLHIHRELITIPLIMIFLNPYVSYPTRALTMWLGIKIISNKSVKGGESFFSFLFFFFFRILNIRTAAPFDLRAKIDFWILTFEYIERLDDYFTRAIGEACNSREQVVCFAWRDGKRR